MAETELKQQKEEVASTSDDEFETVVRKRHSHSQKYRGGGGGMTEYTGGNSGSGRGRGGDRDFSFSTRGGGGNSRAFRRRSYRESSRGEDHHYYGGKENRGDRDHSHGGGGRRHGGEQRGDKDKQQQHNAVPSHQQPPTTSPPRGQVHIAHAQTAEEKEASATVAPPTPVPQLVEEESEYFDPEVLALLREEVPKVTVLAPPPAVNPWHVNKNAVSVITKKVVPEGKPKSSVIAPSEKLTLKDSSTTTASVGTLSSSPSPVKSEAAKNHKTPPPIANNNNNNSPQPATNQSHNNGTSSSSQPSTTAEQSKHDIILSLRSERDKDNKQHHNAVHDQGPASPAAAAEKEVLPAIDDPTEYFDPEVLAQLREEEPKLLIIAPAPPPTVNPWRVNKNAVSVITKKVVVPETKPTLNSEKVTLKDPSTSSTITTLNPSPSAPVKSEAAKNHKTPPTTTTATTNNNNNSSQPPATTTEPLNNGSTCSPLHPSTVDQSKDINLISRSDNNSPSALQTQQRTDIQQGPKFRRGFAAVTKYHKGINSNNNSPLSSSRSSVEDWPSLQTTIVVTVAPQAHKPVISMTHETKLTGANSRSGDATSSSETDDIPLLKKEDALPSDPWPSVTASIQNNNNNNKESSLESGWHSGSDLNNEDTPSEASTGTGGEPNKDLPDSRVHSENGSTTSSDDQGVVDDQLDAEANSSGGSKKNKKPKQKWVKLDLPSTPKSKLRRDRSSVEREQQQREKEKEVEQNQNDLKVKAKVPSSYNKDIKDSKISNGPQNEMRHNYQPRGRGRANNSVRGGGRSRQRGGHYWSYRDAPASENILSAQNGHEDYQDYPADYTTLPPLYPMTEFVMPYTNEAYYPTGYTPPQGPVVEDPQLAAGYVPVEASILLEMVKKQIEYYFSEENLEKDFYLRRKMDKEGFLPLNFIATFPRVKVMTQDPSLVIQAIQASQDIELTEDFLFVRTRNDPHKWPISSYHSHGIASPTVIPFPTHSFAYQTNGFNTHSSDTDSPTTSTSPFGTAEKLNPEVPEFIPRSLTA